MRDQRRVAVELLIWRPNIAVVYSPRTTPSDRLQDRPSISQSRISREALWRANNAEATCGSKAKTNWRSWSWNLPNITDALSAIGRQRNVRSWEESGMAAFGPQSPSAAFRSCGCSSVPNARGSSMMRSYCAVIYRNSIYSMEPRSIFWVAST